LFIVCPAVISAAEPEVYEDTLRPVIERFGSGSIDWQTGVYRAEVEAPFPEVYRGRPVNDAMGEELARRAAGALADSVFLQLVSNTRVDSKMMISDLAEGVANIRIIGNISGKHEVASSVYRAKERKVLKAEYRVSMHGVGGVISNIYDAVVASSINQQSVASGDSPDYNDGQAVFMIDARGTGARPAIFPRILNEQNQVVYDASMAGKEKAVSKGVAEYMTTTPYPQVSLNSSGRYPPILMVKAVAFRPVSEGDNVYAANKEETQKRKKRKRRKAIKGVQVKGLHQADIIISNQDAQDIKTSDKKTGWLKKSRIIIITDTAIGGTEGREERSKLWLAAAILR
jgi:hypothetical protein